MQCLENIILCQSLEKLYQYAFPISVYQPFPLKNVCMKPANPQIPCSSIGTELCSSFSHHRCPMHFIPFPSIASPRSHTFPRFFPFSHIFPILFPYFSHFPIFPSFSGKTKHFQRRPAWPTPTWPPMRGACRWSKLSTKTAEDDAHSCPGRTMPIDAASIRWG